MVLNITASEDNESEKQKKVQGKKGGEMNE